MFEEAMYIQAVQYCAKKKVQWLVLGFELKLLVFDRLGKFFTSILLTQIILFKYYFTLLETVFMDH